MTKYEDRLKTVDLLNMATILSIIVWTRLQKNLNAFNINSSDIWYHFSSIAMLSEAIFVWEVEFVLFSKTSHIV